MEMGGEMRHEGSRKILAEIGKEIKQGGSGWIKTEIETRQEENT